MRRITTNFTKLPELLRCASSCVEKLSLDLHRNLSLHSRPRFVSLLLPDWLQPLRLGPIFSDVRQTSVCLAACGYRPERLDLALADADIPVVDIAGGITVPRHEPQLLIDLQHALGVVDDTVLV